MVSVTLSLPLGPKGTRSEKQTPPNEAKHCETVDDQKSRKLPGKRDGSLTRSIRAKSGKWCMNARRVSIDAWTKRVARRSWFKKNMRIIKGESKE